MNSLRFRLWLLWILTLLASAGVAVLLVELVRSSDTAQTQRAEAVAARACGIIGDRFSFYTAGATTSAVAGAALRPVVVAALAHQPGVEGGIWSETAGSLAYAFPTDTATGTQPDLAANELATVRAANAAAAAGEQTVLRQLRSGAGTLLVAACPLPAEGLTAWAMTRAGIAANFDSLRAGLALLGGLVVLIAGGVTWLTVTWGRHVRRIEAALRDHDIADLPRLAPTGERELDRIILALNAAGERIAKGRIRATELADQVATAERLAALGRVAAGLAHEMRNPMAAMRLRAENALAGDPARLRPALQASLDGIGRMDRLLAEMLAMTQRRTPEPVMVNVAAFLQGRAEAQRERAAASGVLLAVEAAADTAVFDPELVARAIDNLLLNAVQHTGCGGRVTLSAVMDGPCLRLAVSDTGPGIDAAIRSRLFEPFATGRPDGTGLGLAIAREMAQAHGGQLRLAEAAGTVFVLDLPQTTPAVPR